MKYFDNVSDKAITNAATAEGMIQLQYEMIELERVIANSWYGAMWLEACSVYKIRKEICDNVPNSEISPANARCIAIQRITEKRAKQNKATDINELNNHYKFVIKIGNMTTEETTLYKVELDQQKINAHREWDADMEKSRQPTLTYYIARALLGILPC